MSKIKNKKVNKLKEKLTECSITEGQTALAPATKGQTP